MKQAGGLALLAHGAQIAQHDDRVQLEQPEQALEQVMDFVDGYRGSLWIVGGWAIDLHLGRVTRQHHDVDVMFRADEQHLFEERFGTAQIDVEDPVSGARKP